MKVRKIIAAVSAVSAILLVAGCSGNSQQDSEKTVKSSKQSSKKQSSKKKSSKKKVYKAKLVNNQSAKSSESSSSESSSSSSNSQSSASSSSSSSKQSQKYTDEEYAAAVLITGENAKYGFGDQSIFSQSTKADNVYYYQGQPGNPHQTRITANANGVYVEYDINFAHPNGMSQTTFSKTELESTLAQEKTKIDSYLSSQQSN
ncbi:hypothetical protein OCH80_06280 [Lactobacillus sp. 23-2]|uniref:hypothetical protein n=1 Tax=Lactobacillus sp. 23-2 TaxID=2981842 RepID=UPI003834ED56